MRKLYVVLLSAALWGCSEPGCKCAGGAGDGSVAASVSKRIGSAGGVVELANGAKVEIPKGALAKEAEISVSELQQEKRLPTGTSAAGKAYAFEPHGTTFMKPVKISIPVAEDADDVIAVKLEDEKDTTWEVVPGAEKRDDTLEIEIESFSQRFRPDSNLVPIAPPGPSAARGCSGACPMARVSARRCTRLGTAVGGQATPWTPLQLSRPRTGRVKGLNP